MDEQTAPATESTTAPEAFKRDEKGIPVFMDGETLVHGIPPSAFTATDKKDRLDARRRKLEYNVAVANFELSEFMAEQDPKVKAAKQIAALERAIEAKKAALAKL